MNLKTIDQEQHDSAGEFSVCDNTKLGSAYASDDYTVSAPLYIPPSKWNQYFAWPPPGGLRHLIFYAEFNGFGPAIHRVGRSVLINAKKFWEIVEGTK